MKFYSVLKTALLLSITITIASCDIPSKNDNYDLGLDAPQGHIINASPGSDEIIFFIDGNQINNQTSLLYGDVDGPFEFNNGNRIFTIENNNGSTLASVETELAYGENFSVFAVNTIESIELKVYKYFLQEPVYNAAQVQFINLSPDANPFSIKDASKTYTENLQFKEATQHVSLSTGTYQFTFTDNETGEELLTASTSIIPGRAYTIFTKGYVNSPQGSNSAFSMQVFRHY